MPLIRDYTEATALEDTDAFVLDREGVGTMFIEAQNMGLGGGSHYVAAFTFLGAPPATSEVMGGHAFTVPVAFPVDFAGAAGYAVTPPASEFTATVYQITGGVPTSIGSMTIGTDGSFSWSVPTATSFAIGDSVKYVGPVGVDASLADLWWSMLGTTA